MEAFKLISENRKKRLRKTLEKALTAIRQKMNNEYLKMLMYLLLPSLSSRNHHLPGKTN